MGLLSFYRDKYPRNEDNMFTITNDRIEQDENGIGILCPPLDINLAEAIDYGLKPKLENVTDDSYIDLSCGWFLVPPYVEMHSDDLGYVMLYCYSGAGRLSFQNHSVEYSVSEGDIIIFDDYQSHQWDSDKVCLFLALAVEDHISDDPRFTTIHIERT